MKSQTSATSLLLTTITCASMLYGACNSNDSSATKAAVCPEGAPLLPPLKSEEFFAGLPERSEAIDPRLQWLVDEARLASDSLFMSCRCGVCRVVQPLETFEDKDRWLVSFQDAVQMQWKELGDYNMVITSERPIEVPEGYYAHVYLNYAAINAR